MLTDLLATVAEGGKILLEEENYLLARVEAEGKPMLTEISCGDTGGIPPGQWPRISGILHPESEIHPATGNDTRILMFSLPEGAELYLEKLVRDGPLSESGALAVGRSVLAILRRLHDAVCRVGYLGPENVLVTPSGEHCILGGARGVPDTPFSPPEAVGRMAHDPRSDVYALGLLIFRLIAGSDSRDVQVEAWNRLSSGVMGLLENMVTPDPGERFANLTVLSRRIDALHSASPGVRTHEKAIRPAAGSSRRFPGWGWVLILLIVAAAVVIMVRNCDGNTEPLTAPPGDTLLQTDTATVTGQDRDTLEADTASSALPAAFEPVIWISNGTGQPGMASEFRQGPVAGYSRVYACTASRRNSSLVLVRRLDPGLPLSEQHQLSDIASSLNAVDSSLTVRPVDITILLGADLLDDRTVPGILGPVSQPAGTLFVDIANHGLGGVYGGAGAATWVRSVLDGRSLSASGEEWMVRVVDFRDGDRLNEELGIPEELDSTAFLYRRDRPLLEASETELRRALLENTLGRGPGSGMPDPPDIWILLGQ